MHRCPIRVRTCAHAKKAHHNVTHTPRKLHTHTHTLQAPRPVPLPTPLADTAHISCSFSFRDPCLRTPKPTLHPPHTPQPPHTSPTTTSILWPSLICFALRAFEMVMRRDSADVFIPPSLALPLVPGLGASQRSPLKAQIKVQSVIYFRRMNYLSVFFFFPSSKSE